MISWIVCTHWPTWTKHLLLWFDQTLLHFILFPYTWNSSILMLTQHPVQCKLTSQKSIFEQLWIIPFIPLSHTPFFIDSFTSPCSPSAEPLRWWRVLWSKYPAYWNRPSPATQIPVSPLTITYLYCPFLPKSTFVFFLFDTLQFKNPCSSLIWLSHQENLHRSLILIIKLKAFDSTSRQSIMFAIWQRLPISSGKQHY